MFFWVDLLLKRNRKRGLEDEYVVPFGMREGDKE